MPKKINLQKGTQNFNSKLELSADDLNYSKNSMGETAKATKSKMIQTIQNNNKERFFSRNREEENSSNPQT
jgi:hypothetical protein